MRKMRMASVLGLAVGAAIGTLPAPTPAAATEISASKTQGQEKAAVPVPVANAYSVRAMLNDHTPLMAERRSAVWQGTAKRGNRRNRSRWSYNR